MTALPLRDFTDAERAKLEAIEAAPAEPESVRERVAMAAHHVLSRHGDCPCGQAGRLDCEDVADAALAVLSGPSSDAERAVERVLEMADDLDATVRWRGDPGPGSYDDGLNQAQANAADRIRAAIAGPPC